jgi:uncharacterized membrane protein YdjX (TVP38/TMEM64 family)
MPATQLETRTHKSDQADAGFLQQAWPRWALLGLLLLAVVLFYALGWNERFSFDYLRAHLEDLKAHVQNRLGQSLLIFFGIYVGAAALSLPAAGVLSVIAGALFGRWLGTAVVSLASTLGATLAMLSARYLLRGFVERRYGHRLAALQEGFDREGAYYLFSLRLVPLFPFFLINLGMSLTRMSVRTFAWVSWLGMLPATFLYINAGTELGQIDSPSKALSSGVIVSLALLAVLPLVFRKLVRARQRKN